MTKKTDSGTVARGATKNPSDMTRRRVLQAAAAVPPLMSIAALPLEALAQGKKELVIAIGADFNSLDPDKYTNWNDYWAYGNMFEGLYAPNAKGDLAPAVAESYEVSKDGLSYKFKLRANAKFHNGEPVTSDDVDFSLKRTADPALRSQRAKLMSENMAGFEKIDDRTFAIKLKKIDADFLAKMSLYWQVKPKKYIEAVGNDEFAKKPIGTGPFEFVERRPKEFTKMKAFAGHWGNVPKVSGVTLRIVPEEQSRLAQVMAGEADVAYPTSPVIAGMLAKNSAIKVVRVPSFLNVLVYFGSGHPEGGKQLVRQALCMAIDKQALVKSIMLGYAEPQELWCTSAQPACSLAGLTPYKYDPKKARAMLEQAKFDFDKPFRFVGMAPGRVAASKETCEAIAEYWKQVGVKVDLQIMEFGAWNSLKSAKEKDKTIGAIYATGPDPSKDVAYKLEVNTHSSLATSWVFDKENDAMLAKMNDFTDAKERNAFLNKILRRFHEQAYMLPLWANDSLFVTGKQVNFDVPGYLAYTMVHGVAKA